MSVETVRNEIKNLLGKVNREGIDRLIEFLDKTDFYTAPASTRFHNNFEGGLAEHSLNVYRELKELTNGEWSEETLIIVGLLHDICKVNNYKVEMRNKKNPDTGVWFQEPYYTTEDLMPLRTWRKISNAYFRIYKTYKRRIIFNKMAYGRI